ncbi:MAG: hypothetical protein F2693_15795 [Actinobacteria bacterium]|nr:hypothetical protein [Actinomycetota bacterium]
MSDGFYFGSALRPKQSSDALTALYLSLVTVATLGFGDVTPADPVLRLLAPFEALLGFVLLTAAISWILQVYPALGRRRSVAKRLSLLQSSHATTVVAGGEPCVASRLLDAVTDGTIQAETDLMQYAESASVQRRSRSTRRSIGSPSCRCSCCWAPPSPGPSGASSGGRRSHSLSPCSCSVDSPCCSCSNDR